MLVRSKHRRRRKGKGTRSRSLRIMAEAPKSRASGLAGLRKKITQLTYEVRKLQSKQSVDLLLQVSDKEQPINVQNIVREVRWLRLLIETHCEECADMKCKKCVLGKTRRKDGTR